VQQLPALQKQRIDIATRVQNAKFLYEMGKYDEAEAILVQVVKDDPTNRSAPYYLDLIKEARYMDDARRREEGVKSAIGRVESAWIQSRKRDDLPKPNPMYDTNLVYTSKGRQRILSKLDSIRLNEVSYTAYPLKEVVAKLRTESQTRTRNRQAARFLPMPLPRPPPARCPPPRRRSRLISAPRRSSISIRRWPISAWRMSWMP